MSENSNNRKVSLSNYSGRQYYRDNLRVLRKNLLFCSGLPLALTEEDIRSKQYFGKYGKVLKVIMLKNLRQMSAYVTYGDPCQASLAIIATNDFQIDRYHKLASIYGTIKYCKYFLKKIQCKNMPNCNYLHVYDKKNQIYIDNQLPDQVFQEHYSIALKLLKQINIDALIKQKKYQINSEDEDQLPCPIQALQRIIRKKSPLKYTEVVFAERLKSNSSRQSIQKQKAINQQNESKDSTIQSLKQQNNQSLQIKLIRKLVREPKSKLSNWTEISNLEQQKQINLFHSELSQLNQLKRICENNILKQLNKQQQRLKFLLIKNIHHKKNTKNENEHLNYHIGNTAKIQNTAVNDRS